jgi:hypothetical protein
MEENYQNEKSHSYNISNDSSVNTVCSVINPNVAVTGTSFSAPQKRGELILLFLWNNTLLISGKSCSAWQ